MSEVLLDAAGRRRSPATMPGFHAGRPPRNKGRRYPADPPTVEEIVAVMRAAGDRRHGCRLRGLIAVLWRAGLRIHEALALTESDLDHRRGALLVRRGKGGRRREVGMDEWGWEHLQRWIDLRLELPVGPLFCVINGPTGGRPWSPAAARAELRPVVGESIPASCRRFSSGSMTSLSRAGSPSPLLPHESHTQGGLGPCPSFHPTPEASTPMARCDSSTPRRRLTRGCRRARARTGGMSATALGSLRGQRRECGAAAACAGGAAL